MTQEYAVYNKFEIKNKNINIVKVKWWIKISFKKTKQQKSGTFILTADKADL